MSNRRSPRLHSTLTNQNIDFLHNMPPVNNDKDNNITEVKYKNTNVEEYDLIDISYSAEDQIYTVNSKVL